MFFNLKKNNNFFILLSKKVNLIKIIKIKNLKILIKNNNCVYLMNLNRLKTLKKVVNLIQ